MYLNIKIELIILTLQCLMLYAAKVKGPLLNHCTITIPPESNYMPLPMYVSRLTGDIRLIYPNETGHIVINDGTNIKLSCAGSNFITPFFFNGDVELKCINGNLSNRGRPHAFSSYKCRTNPKPRVMLTRNMCQLSTNRIMEVGFETYYGFKKMYKICFNTHSKTPVYTWHFKRTPINIFQQISTSERIFMNTYYQGGIDVMEVYQNQSSTLEKLLKSKELADKYVDEAKETKRYLAPALVLSEDDFLYNSEQYSAYFLENTAPQWLSFNKGVWNEVEKLFLKNINSSRPSTHLIVSGTYLPTMLPDKDGEQRAIYLHEPRMIPVPQYLWKMDYNIENEVGIVYIAMTNPYLTMNETGYICDTMPCPNIELLSIEARKVVYCCSKKSFEKMFKVLDPAVYDRF